jgi:hypothetical protein
MDFKARIQ